MTLQFWAEFLVSRFFYLVPMITGGLLFWWLTRFVSMGTGIRPSEAKQEILNGNVAMAEYLGRRILAVGIAVAGCAIAGAIAADLT